MLIYAEHINDGARGDTDKFRWPRYEWKALKGTAKI